jgi:glucans biosynthesis protein C
MDDLNSPSLTKPRGPRPSERGPSSTGGGPAEMGNALESLRVASTLFVILYHAALSYVATPLRLTLWVAFDSPGHVAFDAFVYWVNGFVMPVFFLAAGVSAPAACESRGPRTFLVHRAQRLLRPLLFGCVTILPAFYLLWGYGLMVTGRLDLDHILSWRYPPHISRDVYGLGHLWFLEYLFCVCVAWCLGWMVRNRTLAAKKPTADSDGWVQALFASPWCPLILAVPTASIFLVDSDTMLRVDNQIVPNVTRLLHYLFFFTVGGWISKVREPRRMLSRFGPAYLALSFAVFAAMWPLLSRHAASPLVGWDRVGLCLLAAMFPWLIVFGGLGVLLRSNQGKGPVMRFLAESSFWVYLVHVPIVAFLQLALLPTSWPALVKFAVVSVVTLVLSYASYGPLVRYSLIGSVVNGARKRVPKEVSMRLGPEAGWLASLGVLVLLLGLGLWSSWTFLLRGNLYEVSAGQVYRSARLQPNDLDRLIGRARLKSVVIFTNGIDRHPWTADMKRVCDSRHIVLELIPLPGDHPPTRNSFLQVIDTLERCPKPVLVEGYRGTDQVGFASAVTQLLAGLPPEMALRQFDLKYGQFSGAEHSPFGRPILDYRDWLTAHRLAHEPGRLREWARQAYPVRVARGKAN